MKKSNNRFIVAIAIMLALTSVTYASGNQVQKTLHYNNIKIVLDGEDITPANSEPFIIDGSTYLPVRAVSEALGLDVEWDSATQTVVLSSEKIIPDVKPEPKPEPIKEENGAFEVADIFLKMQNIKNIYTG